MDVTSYALFPTRLVAVQHADTADLDADLCGLFDGPGGFADDFDMHPDSLNLLSLAATVPAVARLRDLFLAGLKQWLAAEGVAGPEGVELVLFSNVARAGEFTLVHNHSADLVGVYYARTADPGDRPAVHLPDGHADYFDPGDGVLVLHDPAFNANLSAVGRRDHAVVHPRPGLMVLFPGYLWHSVTPHRGDFRRLAFSMNFTLRWPGQSAAEYHPLG